jgi:23S rRNA (guanosine2251-2'-O)-methyltransferase
VKKLKTVLIIHNVRSAHNVGSLLRSADGLGAAHAYFTGYTPYPKQKSDHRLPHISEKMERQITKTALGAEKSVSWSQEDDIKNVISRLKNEGFLIAALEQTPKAKNINEFTAHQNTALIIGNEVDGIDEQTLALADVHLQIPMRGKKESLNAAIAGSIALYRLTQNQN